VTAPELETYLVGGAVRDRLLGREVEERDWVVVGATPERMLALGYRQVGRDFPVFLHPETGEEYALARTERKSGHGYTGFVVDSDPGVTLEQDLARRDLTVNAMAEDAAGNLVDPWGGLSDLRAQILRHVSPAFVEDPLRVLRVARFAARYAPLGFTIAPETLALMRQIAASGELLHLPAERVWQELERALGEASPQTFFATLGDCGAQAALFPDWPVEPDQLQRLQRAAELCGAGEVRFAALTAQLPPEALTRLCERLRAPNSYREMSLLCSRFGAGAAQPGAESTLALLDNTDAWRRPERFADFLVACSAIFHLPEQRADTLRQALARCRHIDAGRFRDAGLRGPEIGAGIQRERLRILEEMDAG
jgi:tRNA nucleotidyltransferase (CCA-adding enzyme)